MRRVARCGTRRPPHRSGPVISGPRSRGRQTEQTAGGWPQRGQPSASRGWPAPRGPAGGHFRERRDRQGFPWHSPAQPRKVRLRRANLPAWCSLRREGHRRPEGGGKIGSAGAGQRSARPARGEASGMVQPPARGTPPPRRRRKIGSAVAGQHCARPAARWGLRCGEASRLTNAAGSGTMNMRRRGRTCYHSCSGKEARTSGPLSFCAPSAGSGLPPPPAARVAASCPRGAPPALRRGGGVVSLPLPPAARMAVQCPASAKTCWLPAAEKRPLTKRGQGGKVDVSGSVSLNVQIWRNL